MKFPETRQELNEVFRKASAPRISEFHGEYLVDMLTVFPSLKRFSHRKIFYAENKRVLGYNVLFNKIWGRFLVEKGVIGVNGSLEAAVINYAGSQNSFLTAGIRDYVRCVEEDKLYIGRFNYLLLGRLHFLGYFSLEKIVRGPGNPDPERCRLI